MLAWRLAKSVEETLNSLLEANGEIIDIYDTDKQANYVNATLVQDPIFNKGFLSFPIDGSFISVTNPLKTKKDQSTETSEQQDFPLMPVFVGDLSSDQI